MTLQEMTYEERYSQADRDEAERQGKTVDELLREGGASMDVDGRWYITGRHGQGADQIRATYKEIPGSDGDVDFSTEDVRSIELGDRVVQELIGENGDTQEDRDSAQFCITAHAQVAQIRAQGRESQRQFEEEMRRFREHDERLNELLGSQGRESQRQFEEEMRRFREHDERLNELLGREIGE